MKNIKKILNKPKFLINKLNQWVNMEHHIKQVKLNNNQKTLNGN